MFFFVFKLYRLTTARLHSQNPADLERAEKDFARLVESRDPRFVQPLSQVFLDPKWLAAASGRGMELVVQTLGEIRDARAIPALVVALNDKIVFGKSPRVAEQAALALGKIGGVNAVEPLLEILNSAGYQHEFKYDDERMGEIRWAAAEALSQIGDPRAAKPMMKALEDKDSRTIRAAARFFGHIREENAVEPLGRILIRLGDDAIPRSHPDNVRAREAAEEVAAALGNLGDRRAIGPLVVALTYSHIWPEVAEAAGESLRRIDPSWMQSDVLSTVLPQLSTVLESPASHRQSAAVGVLREFGIEKIVPWLKNSSLEIARPAAQALGHLQDPRALGPLVSVLAEGSINPVSTVVEALQKVDPDWRRSGVLSTAIECEIDRLARSMRDPDKGAAELRTAVSALNRLDRSWRESDGARKLTQVLMNVSAKEDGPVEEKAALLRECLDPDVTALLELLDDKERGLGAAFELAERGDPRAIRRLVEEVNKVHTIRHEEDEPDVVPDCQWKAIEALKLFLMMKPEAIELADLREIESLYSIWWITDEYKEELWDHEWYMKHVGQKRHVADIPKRLVALAREELKRRGQEP